MKIQFISVGFLDSRESNTCVIAEFFLLSRIKPPAPAGGWSGYPDEMVFAMIGHAIQKRCPYHL